MREFTNVEDLNYDWELFVWLRYKDCTVYANEADALEEARASLAAVMGAGPEELIFTSGGTEASNMAIKGVALALGEKKGRHIVSTGIEDFAVL